MDVLMDDLAHYTQEIHEEEQWHVWKKNRCWTRLVEHSVDNIINQHNGVRQV
jgi:hypothetical protein